MADAARAHELIIVRRHDEEEHEHHSSAWKVAHADFMTAMMAFFLILWLINATDDEVQKGISAYFNPIHMSDGTSDLKGLSKPSDGNRQAAKGHTDTLLASAALNLLKLAAGKADGGEGEEVSEAEAAAALDEAVALLKAVAGAAKANGGDEDKAKGGEGDRPKGDTGGERDAAGGNPGDEGAATAGLFGDREAFQDPYAVLAKLAEQYDARLAGSPYAVEADPRGPGASGGIVERDPFDPAYWQTTPVPAARGEQSGETTRRTPIPEGMKPDAAILAAEAGEVPAAANGAAERPLVLTEPTEPMADAAVLASRAGDDVDTADGLAVLPPLRRRLVPAERDGTTESRPGQVAGADAGSAGETEPLPPATARASAVAAASAVPPSGSGDETAKAEAARSAASAASVALSETLATEIERSVAAMSGDPSPTLTVTATGEGVIINLTDDASYAMFGIGSAVPDAKTVVLIERLASVLAERPGNIVVRGFTDGRPFRSAEYDNWRLSAARAHMAYYMLVRGGIDETRIVSIEGHADRELKNPDDAYAAENRRIEILLREKP